MLVYVRRRGFVRMLFACVWGVFCLAFSLLALGFLVFCLVRAFGFIPPAPTGGIRLPDAFGPVAEMFERVSALCIEYLRWLGGCISSFVPSES